MKRRTNSLANRLTSSFVITAALPLIVLSLIFGWVFFSFSASAVETRQKNILDVSKSYVEGYFSALEKEMSLMGNLASRRESGWQRTVALICRNSIEKYITLSMTDENGQELARFESCEPTSQLSDRAREEAFFRAQRGELFVGGVAFSEQGEPLTTVSFSTKAESGRAAIVIARVNLGNIWQPLNDLQIGDGGYIFVVDRLGNLIGYRDPQLIRQARNLSTLPSIAPLISKGAGARALSYVGLLGEPVVGSSTRIDRLNWGLALEQPASQIHAARNRMALITLLMILGFVAAASFSARYLTRSIVAPIQRLAQGAEAVAAGNLNVSLQAESDDEIGLTAGAFNLMTARLRELVASLEERVAERTARMERRNRELALTAQVGQNVSQTREIHSLLSGAAELIHKFFDMYCGQVFLLDPKTDELALQYATGEIGARLMAQGRRLPLNERSLNGKTALSKVSIVVADAAQSPDFIPDPLLPETRSEIVMPLLAGETLIGVFDLRSDQAGKFDEDTLYALEPIAAQIAIAIQNARLLQETLQARAEVEAQAEQTRAALEQVEEQARQTEAALQQAERQARLTQKISEAGLLFNRAADLQELTKAALETLAIPEMNRAVLEIFHYNSQNEIDGVDVVANWWSGQGPQPTPVGKHYAAEELPLVNLFLSEVPIFIEDAFLDGRIDDVSLETVKRLNIHAIAILPLFVGARQIGVLLLESEETYRFKEDEIRLFSAMAPQISIVLENRRQFERARRQAEHQAMLNLISQKIQNAASVEAALQIAAHELGRALDIPLTVAQLSLKDKP